MLAKRLTEPDAQVRDGCSDLRAQLFEREAAGPAQGPHLAASVAPGGRILGEDSNVVDQFY